MKTEIINEVPHLVFEKGDEKELSQFVGVGDTLWKLPNKEVWINRIGPLTFESIVEVESGFMVRAIPQPSITDLKIGDYIRLNYRKQNLVGDWVPSGFRLYRIIEENFKRDEQFIGINELKSFIESKNARDIRLIGGAGVPLRSE